MSILKKFRLQRGLSAEQMARCLKISHQTLRDLETGRRLPGWQVARRIRQELGLALPCKEQTQTSRLIRQARPCPYDLPTYSVALWESRARIWTPLLSRLGLKPVVPDWLPGYLKTDSALEVLAWLILLSLGARAGLSNPHSLGFSTTGILLQEREEALGPRVLVHLHLLEHSLVLWPQVSLRAGSFVFRVDALMLSLISGRQAWSTLEIDGPGHRSQHDGFRLAQIGLPELRLDHQEVSAGNFLPKILDFLRGGSCPEIVKPCA